MCYNRRATIGTAEDAEEEAEHVKGRETSGQQANSPENVITIVTMRTGGLGLGQECSQNLVFTPETSKGNNTADRQCTD